MPVSKSITNQYVRDYRKPGTHTNLGADANGEYTRHESGHRNTIKPGTRFEPDAGRYHLHISLACPWASGVLTALYIKGLEHVISHSVVHPVWGKTKPDNDKDEHCGWIYRAPGDESMTNSLGHGCYPCDDGLVPDHFTLAKTIRDVYEMAGDPHGPFTTPVLYDLKEGTIVNNESMDIMRLLNSAFYQHAQHPEIDLFPEESEDFLSKLNAETIYPKINNGVYRSGFARTQEAYDKAVSECFEALETVEVMLSKSRFLAGESITWLDLRLFHTLVRFDPVYTCYFKTNLKRIGDYPNLLGFVRDLYAMQPIQRSINMAHIKTHYYSSHPHLNTFGIIPAYDGPDLKCKSGRGQGKASFHTTSVV